MKARTKRKRASVRRQAARRKWVAPAEALAPVAIDPAKPPAVISLHNLGLRWERDELIVEHRAADVDRPDHIVSRARLNPHYHRLRALGTISSEQSRAADRYAELVEAEVGASRISQAGAVGHVAGWQRAGVAMSQVLASTDLRLVNFVLGKRARMLLAMLVVGDMGIKAMAEFLRCDADTLQGEVLAALTRCVEHWNLGPVTRRPRRARLSPPGPADPDLVESEKADDSQAELMR